MKNKILFKYILSESGSTFDKHAKVDKKLQFEDFIWRGLEENLAWAVLFSITEPQSRMQNEVKKRVSIIGCGWLGAPLAHVLHAGGDFSVKGSATSEEKVDTLKVEEIEAYVATLSPDPKGEFWENLLDAEYLVVNIPPRSSKQGEEFHPQQMKYLASMIETSPVTDIIYVSSTSVYPELNRVVVEEDVEGTAEAAAAHLVEAEEILLALRRPNRRVAVLRCGGLMGYDRIPGKYVRGKTGITTGEVPVNYVHRDDVVGIIEQLLRSLLPNETFNVVAPLHPVRREVYNASCTEFGWEVPTYAESTSEESFKIVGSGKVVSHLNYEFKFPNPLNFYYRLP